MIKSKFIAMAITVATVISSVGMVFAYDVDDYSENDNRVVLISENYDTPVVSHYDDSIKVLLNDQIIDFTDENGEKVDPQIIGGRTMVPMRKIFEVFGADINWESETQTITATTGEKELTLQIDNKAAKIKTAEETKDIILDTAPVIVDGRTVVPVRFIAESLDLKVGWDPNSKTVIVLDTGFIVERLQKDASVFSELLTANYTNPTTSESKITSTANVKYTNSNDKTSNTNIKVVLNGTGKVSENAIAADVTVKTTGKGELYDSMKDENLTNIKCNVILDKETMDLYLKSNLLESEFGSNWLKVDYTEDIDISKEELKSYLNSEELSIELKDIVDVIVDEIELTPTTYYEIDEMLDLICNILGDKHFSSTGRTTKTYTYELTAKDIASIFGINLDTVTDYLGLDYLEAKLSYSIKVSNNVNTEANFAIDFSAKCDYETVDFDLTSTSKLTSQNKKVTISMPSEKDVVEY